MNQQTDKASSLLLGVGEHLAAGERTRAKSRVIIGLKMNVYVVLSVLEV